MCEKHSKDRTGRQRGAMTPWSLQRRGTWQMVGWAMEDMALWQVPERAVSERLLHLELSGPQFPCLCTRLNPVWGCWGVVTPYCACNRSSWLNWSPLVAGGGGGTCDLSVVASLGLTPTHQHCR